MWVLTLVALASATPRVVFQSAEKIAWADALFGPPGPRKVKLTTTPAPTTTTTTTTTTSVELIKASPSYPEAVSHEPQFTVEADPTLEPGRLRNFVPVPSAVEAAVLRYGPTGAPDRGSGVDHGCVWQPGFYGCDCKDVMAGCQEASLSCEVALQKEEMASPDAARRHFMATFDNQLLNAVQKRTLRGRAPGYVAGADYKPGFPVAGYPWGQTDFTSKLKALGADHRMPAEFGHQLFEDPPDWDSLIRGKCTLEEMDAIQSCLSYFHGCHSNFVAMRDWRTNAEQEAADAVRLRLGGFGGSPSWGVGASAGT